MLASLAFIRFARSLTTALARAFNPSMRVFICLASICLAMLDGIRPLQAQRVPSWSGTGIVSGIVRHSGLAIGRRLRVCALYWTGPQAQRMTCDDVQESGTYTVDSLPFASIQISVNCDVLNPFRGGFLATDTVTLESSPHVRHDWNVIATSCDPRPLRRVSGEFRGHYSGGFEESEFVPCPADTWIVPGDSLHLFPFLGRRAWATWSERVGRSVKWPAGAPRESFGTPRFFVRWRGTVVGPGSYGHMRMSPFEFLIDSVFELRAPSSNDCG
jgi:hypothetical protein